MNKLDSATKAFFNGDTGRYPDSELNKLRSLKPDFLYPDNCGKGYVCPVCGSGSHSPNGDGLKPIKGEDGVTRWHCFACNSDNPNHEGRTEDTIGWYALANSITDFNEAVVRYAHDVGIVLHRDGLTPSTRPASQKKKPTVILPVEPVKPVIYRPHVPPMRVKLLSSDERIAPENIPNELKQRAQWVGYRREDKAPLKIDANGTAYPSKGGAKDSKNWTTFERAYAAYQAGIVDGIGFSMAAGGGIVGIDLDHQIDDNGNLSPLASELVQSIGSYWELSPSGRGIHIWVMGELTSSLTAKGIIEVYHGERYFTVTGHGTGVMIQNQAGIALAVTRAKEEQALINYEVALKKYQLEIAARPEPTQVISETDTNNWLPDYAEFCADETSIDWLVEGYIQRGGTHMLVGASGSGKTHIALSIALAIAGASDNWFGQRVQNGRVVYLAGEGHAGLKQRAWGNNQALNIVPRSIKMNISRMGFDLDDIEVLNKVMEKLDTLSEPPVLIVIDTLHRFMTGDENKAQDTRALLKSCETLQRRYGCAILFVHHTGKARDAQDTGRGSSAWKGALESEMLVKKNLGSNNITFEHNKAKDTPQMPDKHFELKPITIEGKRDQYGNSVSTVILTESNQPAIVEKPLGNLTKAQRECLNTFLSAMYKHGTFDNNHRYCITKTQLFEEYDLCCQATGKNDGKPGTLRQGRNRLLNNLIKSDLIRYHTDSSIDEALGFTDLTEQKCIEAGIWTKPNETENERITNNISK